MVPWYLTCFSYYVGQWKSTLDKGKNPYALFADISEVFDTIDHDLFLAKLKTYGF